MLRESVSEINYLAPGEVEVLHLERHAGGYHWPTIEAIPFEFPQTQPDNESSGDHGRRLDAHCRAIIAAMTRIDELDREVRGLRGGR